MGQINLNGGNLTLSPKQKIQYLLVRADKQQVGQKWFKGSSGAAALLVENSLYPCEAKPGRRATSLHIFDTDVAGCSTHGSRRGIRGISPKQGEIVPL